MPRREGRSPRPLRIPQESGMEKGRGRVASQARQTRLEVYIREHETSRALAFASEVVRASAGCAHNVHRASWEQAAHCARRQVRPLRGAAGRAGCSRDTRT